MLCTDCWPEVSKFFFLFLLLPIDLVGLAAVAAGLAVGGGLLEGLLLLLDFEPDQLCLALSPELLVEDAAVARADAAPVAPVAEQVAGLAAGVLDADLLALLEVVRVETVVGLQVADVAHQRVQQHQRQALVAGRPTRCSWRFYA